MLRKIIFFPITYAVSSEMVITFILVACCENVMFILGFESKKTFDTMIKSAVFLLPIVFPKKINFSRNIKLFEVFPTYLVAFLELSRLP